MLCNCHQYHQASHRMCASILYNILCVWQDEPLIIYLNNKHHMCVCSGEPLIMYLNNKHHMSVCVARRATDHVSQ